MKTLVIILLFAFAATAVAFPARAGYLAIQSDPVLDYNSAKCVNSAAQVEVHVVWVPTPGDQVRRIQFAVLAPGSCVSLVGRRDVHVLPTVGNSDIDIVVDLLGCPTVPTHVLTIRLLGLDVHSNCCSWRATSPEGYALVGAWDCDGIAVQVQTRALWFATEPCAFVPPHTPDPADGAVIDSLSTVLQWQSTGGPVCIAGDELVHNVYFGTDPGALVPHTGAVAPFDVTGLLPGVTYYWQVEATTPNGAGPYPGPLWSFTTPPSLASRRSTWGGIKALFR